MIWGHRRGTKRKLLLAGAALLVVGAASPGGATAAPSAYSEPAEHDIRVASEAGVKTYTWKGELPPTPTGIVGYATEPCLNDPDLEDVHLIKIDLAPRVYSNYVVEYVFQITWDDPGNDLALNVVGPVGSVGSSDGGTPVESVVAFNLDEGEYTVNPCAFAAAGSTPYNGLLKVTAKPKKRPKPAAATTTTARPAAAASSGSGSSGSSSGSPSASGPSSASPSRPSSSASRIGPLAPEPTAPSNVAPVQAAPPAFISSGLDPVETAAPVAAPTVASETKSMPIGLAILVSALGLAGLGLALLFRRRRGLDVTPGTAVVPVNASI